MLGWNERASDTFLAEYRGPGPQTILPDAAQPAKHALWSMLTTNLEGPSVFFYTPAKRTLYVHEDRESGRRSAMWAVGLGDVLDEECKRTGIKKIRRFLSR